MNSLEDAWRWYRDARDLLQLMQRLAVRHWDELPWDGHLGRDDRFRTLEGTELESKARFSLDHLDDLAVIVLFSVFESLVRDRVRREVEDEAANLRHVALRLAAREMIDRIDQ